MVICILMRPACALALTHLSFFKKKIYEKRITLVMKRIMITLPMPY